MQEAFLFLYLDTVFLEGRSCINPSYLKDETGKDILSYTFSHPERILWTPVNLFTRSF